MILSHVIGVLTYLLTSFKAFQIASHFLNHSGLTSTRMLLGHGSI